MKTKILTVDPQAANQRLDKFLLQFPEMTSRSFAQDLISKGLVIVDGKPAKASLLLKLKQIVEINIPEIENVGLAPYDLPLDIVFEDDDLIVLNKPSGLVVHPAAGHEQDTLVNALINHTNQLSMKNELRPGIVHRLDKETSGLLVVAKNDFTHEKLAEQFKNKTSHRIYYAIVEKEPKIALGTIQSYLARHPVDRKRYASLRNDKRIITRKMSDDDDQIGKWAVTHFKVLSVVRADKNLNVSYVKLKLETGRTHQIRVHMSEMNTPLLGDTVYGGSAAFIKKFNLTRFFLHAAELGFIHPRSNETLLFKVAWSEADRKKIKELGFEDNLPGV